jgi:hypothetical protein
MQHNALYIMLYSVISLIYERLNNPFLLAGYTDELHFCDRINETNQLISNINNGENTTLFALR